MSMSLKDLATGWFYPSVVALTESLRVPCRGYRRTEDPLTVRAVGKTLSVSDSYQYSAPERLISCNAATIFIWYWWRNVDLN